MCEIGTGTVQKQTAMFLYIYNTVTRCEGSRVILPEQIAAI